MMLWSLLLSGMLGAGADSPQETPNQSLSITSVATSSTDSATPPNGDPQQDSTVPVEPGERTLAPRSSPSRFLSQQTATAEGETSNPSRQRTMWWLTTMFGLIIVLAVIFAGSKVLQRYVPGLGNSYSEGPIHLLYRTHLGPKQSVCMFRCGSRVLVVGITAEQMHTLTEITDPVEIDYIKGQCMQVRPNSTSRAFRDALRESERSHGVETEPSSRVDRTERSDGANRAEKVDIDPRSTTPEELTRQLGNLRERILSIKGKQQP